MTAAPCWHEISEGRIAAPAGRRAWPSDVLSAAAMVAEIQAAAERVDGHSITTPVRAIEVRGAQCTAKLESLQRTGSFKIRGASNRIMTLSGRERDAGVVTASSGNHGIAVAQLAADLGIPAVVCVPRDADPAKLRAIRATGADVIADTEDYDACEQQARKLSSEIGGRFIHPFDDVQVIAGHATVGLELLAQAPGATAVLIPLSGGGLAAGVASALRTAGVSARLIGISPANAPVMYHALLAGAPVPVQERPTMAGALSGGLGDRNDHSFALVSGLLDEVWLVSEEEIAAAMIWGAESLGTAIEGAGAASLAALARPAATEAGRDGPVVAVVTGGNVDASTLQRARRTVAHTRQPERTPEPHPSHP